MLKIFLITVIVLYPLEVFLNNISEFNYDTTLYIFLLNFFFVTLILLLPKKKIDFKNEKIFFFLVFLSFSNYVLANSGLKYNIFYIAALFLVSIFISKSKTLGNYKFHINRFIYIFFLLTVSINIFLNKEYIINKFGYVKISDFNPYKQNIDQITNLTSDPSKKNIIHIILDEAQTELFIHLLNNEKKIEDGLKDFIFFKENISNYPNTSMSIGSILSGDLYDNSESRLNFMKKIEKNENSIPHILKDNNYKINYKSSICYREHLKLCKNFFSTVIEEIKMLYIFTLRKYLNINQNNFEIYAKIFRKEYNFLKKNFDKINFNNLNNYNFFHIVSAHSPPTLDKNCNFEYTNYSFIKHTSTIECHFNFILNLIKKMKLSNTYNNSMIIIHSDHGSMYKIKETNNLVNRASALLLIKPFNNNSEEIEVSIFQSSNIDIKKTIIQNLNINSNTNNKHYNLIESKNLNFNTKRKFHFYKWEKNLESKIGDNFGYFEIYEIEGDFRRISNWTKVY